LSGDIAEVIERSYCFDVYLLEEEAKGYGENLS